MVGTYYIVLLGVNKKMQWSLIVFDKNRDISV